MVCAPCAARPPKGKCEDCKRKQPACGVPGDDKKYRAHWCAPGVPTSTKLASLGDRLLRDTGYAPSPVGTPRGTRAAGSGEK